MPGPAMHALYECQPIQREWRQCQRPDREADKEERRVIGRRAVGVKDAAACATVDEHPLSLAAHGDRDRLHAGAALVEHGAVARPVVDVSGPEAGGAVIAMLSTRSVGRHVETAVDATE